MVAFFTVLIMAPTPYNPHGTTIPFNGRPSRATIWGIEFTGYPLACNQVTLLAHLEVRSFHCNIALLVAKPKSDIQSPMDTVVHET